jgi:hypothetical protein
MSLEQSDVNQSAVCKKLTDVMRANTTVLPAVGGHGLEYFYVLSV